MNLMEKDCIIIGGGPAGLAAAIRLREAGVRDIVVIERERQAGGILRQCIHDGFGLTRFQESLSGPEYAWRFLEKAVDLNIPLLTETTALKVCPDKTVIAVSRRHGWLRLRARAVVLAMGCRERTRGAIGLPGTRPAGVLTAGVAQSYINIHNLMIGRDAVILGSGDIGLIMARRLTLEGARVHAVLEIQPHAGGLPRNIRQCLDDYGIPLLLEHTVVDIRGTGRLESILAAKVDANRNPVPGSEREFRCDTLILSVGLIPENELSLTAGIELDPRTGGAIVDEHYQTSVPGIFSAGNVLHVHDLVDFVSLEAETLAESVAVFLKNGCLESCPIALKAGSGVSYVLPHTISGTREVTLSLRVREPLKPCLITVRQAGGTVLSRRFAKALPAEMIHLPLEAEIVNGRTPLEVTAV